VVIGGLQEWQRRTERNSAGLRALFRAGDGDVDGLLTYDEFLSVVRHADAQRAERQVGSSLPLSLSCLALRRPCPPFPSIPPAPRWFFVWRLRKWLRASGRCCLHFAAFAALLAKLVPPTREWPNWLHTRHAAWHVLVVVLFTATATWELDPLTHQAYTTRTYTDPAHVPRGAASIPRRRDGGRGGVRDGGAQARSRRVADELRRQVRVAVSCRATRGQPSRVSLSSPKLGISRRCADGVPENWCRPSR
jgi:hypothetical protein